MHGASARSVVLCAALRRAQINGKQPSKSETIAAHAGRNQGEQYAQIIQMS